MKTILIIISIATLIIQTPDIVEIYEFKSEEENKNQYIAFENIDGKLKGFYFGTEDGKEHGVFFYSAEMINLKVSKDGSVQFEIGERRLFETTRFRIVKGQDKPEESVGFSRHILKYKGQFNKDKMELTCSSERLLGR